MYADRKSPKLETDLGPRFPHLTLNLTKAMTPLERKKEQIARSFQEYFETFGYQKTSVDEIAQTLHISKKTIYNLFRSKRDILDYVVSQQANTMSQEIQSVLDSQTTDRRKIESMIGLILDKHRVWQKKRNSLKQRNKIELNRLAFNKAFYTSLKHSLQDGKRRNVFSIRDVDLTLNFIEAILNRSEEILSRHPARNLTREVNKAINKLLLN